jgi:hypothetical protein
MGVYKMSRKKIIIAALGLLIIGIFLILNSQQQNATVGDGKGPETNGPRVIKLYDDAKLNSLLDAPQFFAAKNELSNYAYLKFGPSTQSATIESTDLQSDGGIVLKIKFDNTKSVEATIHSTNAQFIFDVPATHYETVTSQSNVLNKYYGL